MLDKFDGRWRFGYRGAGRSCGAETGQARSLQEKKFKLTHYPPDLRPPSAAAMVSAFGEETVVKLRFAVDMDCLRWTGIRTHRKRRAATLQYDYAMRDTWCRYPVSFGR